MATANHAIAGVVNYRVINANKIEFDGDWAAQHLVKVTVPQLVGVNCEGQKFNGVLTFFKAAVPQLLAAFAEIEARGLLPLILSYDGSFNPRPIRGTSNISNHALGLAIDINADWNGLGQTPKPAGARGSVAELVAIFKKWGFGWGGDYRKRKDGMHFEVVKIVPVSVADIKAPAIDAAPAKKKSDAVIVVSGNVATRITSHESNGENWVTIRDALDAAGVTVTKEGVWSDGTPALFVAPKAAA